MSRFRKRKGFTLVELVLTLIVAAILSAVVIAGFQAVVRKAQVESARMSVNTLLRETQALQSFHFDGTFGQGTTYLDVAIQDLPTDHGSWSLAQSGPVNCGGANVPFAFVDSSNPYAGSGKCFNPSATGSDHTFSWAISDDGSEIAVAMKTNTGVTVYGKIDALNVPTSVFNVYVITLENVPDSEVTGVRAMDPALWNGTWTG